MNDYSVLWLLRFLLIGVVWFNAHWSVALSITILLLCLGRV